MEKHIQIRCCWTDSPSIQLKNDFINLANTVFGSFVTDYYYKTKFEENVYGPSLLTVLYVDNQPAGADIMWRNDLNGVKAFQTVDTCVLEQYRGMGLFKKMTCWELNMLGENTPVYGFPNVNSFPGYVRMGWLVKRLYKTPTFLLTNLSKDNIVEKEYAVWWLKAQPGIMHVQKKGNYFLIRKKKGKPFATLMGRVDGTTARLFPELNNVCLFKRFETKPSFYNKNKSIPLVCNQPGIIIPYWRIDAI